MAEKHTQNNKTSSTRKSLMNYLIYYRISVHSILIVLNLISSQELRLPMQWILKVSLNFSLNAYLSSVHMQ